MSLSATTHKLCVCSEGTNYCSHYFCRFCKNVGAEGRMDEGSTAVLYCVLFRPTSRRLHLTEIDAHVSDQTLTGSRVDRSATRRQLCELSPTTQDDVDDVKWSWRNYGVVCHHRPIALGMHAGRITGLTNSDRSSWLTTCASGR